jgi:hypothetical protein
VTAEEVDQPVARDLLDPATERAGGGEHQVPHLTVGRDQHVLNHVFRLHDREQPTIHLLPDQPKELVAERDHFPLEGRLVPAADR